MTPALIAESVLVVPLSVKAQMARDGIAPNQLQRWWSPDTERRVDPFDDPEVRAAIRHLLSDIWHAPVRQFDGGEGPFAVPFSEDVEVAREAHRDGAGGAHE